MTNERIVKLLSNLKALYENEGATENEKFIAESKYDELLNKYSIDESDLTESEVPEWYWFHYDSTYEKMLIIQIACQVIDSSSITIQRKQRSRAWIIIEMTKSQSEVVKFLHEFYMSRLHTQLESFTKAFLFKNKIASSTPSDNRVESHMEDDEVERIAMFSAMITKDTPEDINESDNEAIHLLESKPTQLTDNEVDEIRSLMMDVDKGSVSVNDIRKLVDLTKSYDQELPHRIVTKSRLIKIIEVLANSLEYSTIRVTEAKRLSISVLLSKIDETLTLNNVQ